VKVEVKYEHKKHQLTAHVGSGGVPNLLGRDWLQQIRLNWLKVEQVKQVTKQLRLEDILDKYSVVFRKELRTMRERN